MGAPSTGKTSFLKKVEEITSCTPENVSSYTGVSHNDVTYSVGDNTFLNMVIWDIKGDGKFHSYYPEFFYGAHGCLLFFDLTNYETFSNLQNWISFIRNYTNNIPIFLIGAKEDLDRKISEEKVQKFTRKYNLQGAFFISNNEDSKDNFILRELADRVIDYLHQYPFKVVFKTNFSQEDEKLYHRFLAFFAICPICRNKNHIDYLRNFYHSLKPGDIKLRERLMTLMIEAGEFDDIYLNKIKLGIPCCSCHKKYF